MKKTITIEWEIHDTRNPNGGFRIGTSRLTAKAKDYAELMNIAINFADSIPTVELERNGINLEEYREYPVCTYYYMTKISKILSIKDAE